LVLSLQERIYGDFARSSHDNAQKKIAPRAGAVLVSSRLRFITTSLSHISIRTNLQS
jgi:hypothetical protein